jgi:probable rRNA maturation factor
MALTVDIIVDDDGWRAIDDLESLTRRAALAALAAALDEAGASEADDELSVLLTDDAAMQRLNQKFRGLDKPTNVLSFPPPDFAEESLLGDISVSWQTVARESEAEGKSVADHYAHMIVHGVLHLIGYDHETDDEAEEMEEIERAALERLGVADPYRDSGGARLTP